MDGGFPSHGCGCDDTAPRTGDLMPISDAVDLALAQVAPLPQIETVTPDAALGRVLVHDVTGTGQMPAFDNAAMDGFALRLGDLEGRCCLPVTGTMAAGDKPRALPEGAALRIFTGAALPEGADAVAMIEHCVDRGHKVHFSHLPARGDNIRHAGSDQAASALLARAGTRLAAHHIGLFAANGVRQVSVTARPRVAIFSTGNELLGDGPGCIADANRPMLLAQARLAGARVTDAGILPDEAAESAAALARAAHVHDLIVTSGAVSMGGKDHLRAALVAAGGRLEGWRVALKPGKPVMFGRIGGAAITGLPGNPFAVFVGFHLFVAAQIERLSGAAPQPFAPVPARAAFDWTRKPGRAEVFPVKLTGYDAQGCAELHRLGRSVSATLMPLGEADGLAIVPAGTDRIAAGDRLTWHPFCAAAAS